MLDIATTGSYRLVTAGQWVSRGGRWVWMQGNRVCVELNRPNKGTVVCLSTLTPAREGFLNGLRMDDPDRLKGFGKCLESSQRPKHVSANNAVSLIWLFWASYMARCSPQIGPDKDPSYQPHSPLPIRFNTVRVRPETSSK